MTNRRSKHDAEANRNRNPSTSSDVEPGVGDAPLGADEVTAFASPVRVSIHSVRKRLADPDGISGKAAIDGVVACGILRDDSPEQVVEVRFSQSKGKRERTLITIEEDNPLLN